MLDHPLQISDQEFDDKVLKSTIPVMVDFWATWCGPCMSISPFMDRIAKDYSGKLVIAEIDVDANPQIPGRYGIQSIPTLVFMNQGKIIKIHTGALPEGMLRKMVDEFLELLPIKNVPVHN